MSLLPVRLRPLLLALGLSCLTPVAALAYYP